MTQTLTRAHAPDHPTPATEDEEEQCPRKLLRHPMALDPVIEAVARKPRLEFKAWRAVEDQFAMKLPPRVLPEAFTMTEIVVADRLALRPVAEIMHPCHADRPRHAHERAEIDTEMFEPKRTGEALVYQSSVHPNRMAETQGDSTGRQEESGSIG
jgi:hypothetical protein